MDAAVFRFFHDQLPDDRQRAFYDAVEAAVRGRKPQVVCPRMLEMTRGDYLHILEHVYDDHPEFFSFYPLGSQVTFQTFSVTVKLFYRYSETLQREYERALESEVAAILRQCFPNGHGAVPELEREKLIFDWITRHVVYDHRSYELLAARRKQEEIDSVAWNAYGALVRHTAVCEGIACAFKLLCDRVGLPSIVALGQGGTGGKTERHAWNLVRVCGRFYHVDCTWDLRSSISTHIPYMRYRYFNLPDRIISVNHTAETKFLPVCGSLRYNPFRIRKLCAATPEEVNRIAVRMADKGADRFAVMAIGFSAAACARPAAEYLARYLHGNVRYFADDSDYFIGFVIEKRGDVIRL